MLLFHIRHAGIPSHNMRLKGNACNKDGSVVTPSLPPGPGHIGFCFWGHASMELTHTTGRETGGSIMVAEF